ncbi:hypothetical protein T265_00380 [Opisthorchis viverrini]|uniref:Uncharacterized protein n=1 Tax=Opisthorchis viverrini TaxID=6198 RepID=A0A075A3J7_OPIVI|nr:hypothetical protein T265_00380 [Opisthorchis viverrini]KER33946.1 hypothetical protein T265_00380 [Opisthorchis viverrini]
MEGARVKSTKPYATGKSRPKIHMFEPLEMRIQMKARTVLVVPDVRRTGIPGHQGRFERDWTVFGQVGLASDFLSQKSYKH